MALLDVKPYDKQYYEEIIKPFLPEKFIDCHTHVWLMEHDPHKTLRSGTQNWPGLVAKENHGQRSLVGYSSWDSKESDTIE